MAKCPYYERQSDVDSAVFGWLKFYGKINSKQARESFGIICLKAVIDRLRSQGHEIDQEYFFNKKMKPRVKYSRHIRYVYKS